MSCAQHPGTYLCARYRRIASRRGPMKANVAIQHTMLIAIWHMGRDGSLYEDPGPDFFTRLHPERARNRARHQLEAMGYPITLGRAGRRTTPDAKCESLRQRRVRGLSRARFWPLVSARRLRLP
jgi:hypothetical protein